MKPIQFKLSNRILQPSGKEYSDNVTDGEQCVSCWRMSFKERLSALMFGRVWLAVLSGDTQPPVSVYVSRNYLQDVGAAGVLDENGLVQCNTCGKWLPIIPPVQCCGATIFDIIKDGNGSDIRWWFYNIAFRLIGKTKLWKSVGPILW